ncbi:MAG: PEP-CTERM sorting domain-containing protein [Planctomycetota bacterium]
MNLRTLALSVLGFLVAGAPSSKLLAQFPNLANRSDVGIFVGQDSDDFVTALDDLFVASTIGDLVELDNRNSPFQFFGPNIDDPFPMQVGGLARAQAKFGQLRTYAEGFVVNAQTSFDSGIPFVTDDGFDDEGFPDFISVDAFASFTDRLQFGGTATGYRSAYKFRVEGFNSGDGTFTALNVTNSGVSDLFFFDQPGAFSEVVTTQSVFVANDQQLITASLQSTFQPFLQSGSEFAGIASSFQTLDLVGIELRDEVTNEVILDVSVTNSTGSFTVPVIAIPEPSGLALVGTGLCLLTVSRRRRFRS